MNVYGTTGGRVPRGSAPVVCTDLQVAGSYGAQRLEHLVVQVAGPFGAQRLDSRWPGPLGLSAFDI